MKVTAALHSEFRISSIDERLYGAFLEHMGRAIYSGIYEPGHPEADENGFRKDVLRLVRELDVPLVRYPGGNFVSAYRWEDGVGPREERPVRLDLAWRTKETNEIGTNEFARWAKAAGTEMMLAVNLGSRGLQAARDYAEYVTHPSGTYWSDLRRSHGVEAPHDVKLWCLGNEMDGPWQIGHKEAKEYGFLANETAKALRRLMPGSELVVCGSSKQIMPTYPEWERQVLDECYEAVDYISLHKYFMNLSGDTLDYFAQVEDAGRYIRAIGGVIDFMREKKRSKHDVYICFDEWNVWYHKKEEDRARYNSWDWPEAPNLLEETYNFEDALLIASLMNQFIRHSDRVKIACIAQLVNVIAPIRAERGGPAWRQTIYWPYQMASLHGRGTALHVAVDGPVYQTASSGDVPYLDLAAVENSPGKVTLFIVNRHTQDHADLSMDLSGYSSARLDWHQQMSGYQLKAVNGPGDEGIRLVAGSGLALEDGTLKGRLAPLSYHVVRLASG